MLNLKNINVTFNKKTPLELEALKNINLKIDNGNFIVIIGGNGAGKSTLMNVIAGDVAVQSGNIYIDDQDVTKLDSNKRADKVARVFQDPLKGSLDNLTIEENFAVAIKRGKLRGFEKALNTNNKKIFYDRIQKLGIGLENRMKDPIGSLSGGQRQALSLLMATIVPSKILLLDEHTAALDPVMAKIVMNLTDEIIRENNLTALMITHSMNQAIKYGNRLIVMNRGEIKKDINHQEKKTLEAAKLVEMIDD